MSLTAASRARLRALWIGRPTDEIAMGQTRKLNAILLTAFLWAAAEAGAQDPSLSRPMFLDETPLTLKISAPFRELARDDDERPEYDAVVEYTDPDGANGSLDIEVRARGRFRRVNCARPPLSLKFSPDAAAATVFAGQDRLKLVTLCRESDNYRDYLTKEFLIYRLFNELTNRSFRVRWATVEYVDPEARRPRPTIEPAFLIEADWEVAERLGMEVIETEKLEIDSLDTQYTALYALFQFMIGNTDWSVRDEPPGDLCCHNGKVIRNSGGPSIVLPYDFDNSGLVSAAYAVPNEILLIRFVTQRFYRGLCAMNGGLNAAILHIDQRRERLIALLDDESLSERSRRRALDYLNDFFAIINDRERRQELIYERCLE